MVEAGAHKHERRSNSEAPWRSRLGVPLLAVVLLAAWLVGEFQSRHGDAFDWELAALVAAAAGTTLLAAGTAWLASTTSQAVTATRELVQLAQDEQEDAARPIVVLMHITAVVRWTSDDNLIVSLVNAGRGPALWVRLNVTYPDPGVTVEPRTIAAIRPEQGQYDATLRLLVRPGARVDDDLFVVSGDYLDRTEDESRRETIKTGPKPASD